MTAHNTLKYLDALPQLLVRYNQRTHSSIDMAPADVNWHNNQVVWWWLFKPTVPFNPSSFRLGDFVRTSKVLGKDKKQGAFGVKSAKGVGSRAVYTVTDQTRSFLFIYTMYNSVNYYQLEDWLGQRVKGRFYESQLQKVKGLPNHWHLAKKQSTNNTKGADRDDKCWWIGRAWPQITRPGFTPEIWGSMSKSWEADDDFVMYPNSGDWGTHPLEPGVTTVRSAFRQELEIPLSLSPDWQVALFSMYYMHSFSNAVLKLPTDWHCQVGYQHAGLPPVVQRSIQLSRHQQFTHFGQVLQELIQQLGLFVMPTLSGGPHHHGQLFMQTTRSTIHGGDQTHRPKLDYFQCDLVDGWVANHKTSPSTFLEIKT